MANSAPCSVFFTAMTPPWAAIMVRHTDRPIPIFRRVSDRMMAGFSPEELALLAQFQRRMLDNLTNSQEKE